VRAFTCDNCQQLVFFENSVCLRCGAALGFDPTLRSLVLAGDARRCANSAVATCNWLVSDSRPLCRSCRLTRTRPNDFDAAGLMAFARAEAAKRRLVFQLLELGLPVGDDEPAFDLVSSGPATAVTGHHQGLITLNLAESDDTHRERVRVELGEPYRTVLGHFRHEIGHYYWEPLVGASASLTEWREVFGDERSDYQSALERHYATGPPPAWEDRHVSEYAAAHPWEDWAESFAHYLHIRDTLQTAGAFGLVVIGSQAVALDPVYIASPVVGAHDLGLPEIINQWLPLTYALNAINRSMGNQDLYPFVLAPKVIDKLAFVHTRIGAVMEAGVRPAPPGEM
jgi:hypothetical protein